MTPGDDGPDALLARAEHLVELGRQDEALAIVRRVIAVTPENPAALEVLVTAALGLGDSRTAVPAARALLAVHPDDAHALTLAAMTFAASKRTDQGRRYADSAIALAPDAYFPHYVRGWVDLCGAVVTDGGLAGARTAAALSPADPDTHRVLGALLLKRGKFDECRAALDAALRLDPAHGAALDDVARLELARWRIVEAAGRFADLLALAPGNRRRARNLGAAFGRLVSRVHTVLVVPALFFLLDLGRTADRIVTYVAIPVLMVTCVTLARSLVARLPDRGLRLLGTSLRRDPLLVVWTLVLGVGLLVLYAVPLAPGRAHATVAGLYCWIVLAGGFGLRVVHAATGRASTKPWL